MSSQGSAFLALWNGFDPTLLDEYECWHTFEHVPERLSVPGFLSGKRYATGEGARRNFFTLYEIEALDVLESAAYRELVDKPTLWSAKMRRSFNGFRRYPCRRVAAAGSGLAGAAATFIMPVTRLADEADRLAAFLSEQYSSGRIASFQVGVSIANPHYKVFSQDFSAEEDSSVVVAVVEATGRPALDELGQALFARIAPALSEAGTPDWEVFDFLYAIGKPELREADGWRIRPRDDLRVLFRAG
ncbi:hypothetical protein [Aquamicrobium sp. LC103]|uniref:hypothetical protein n=1 Tax=Aquamicrobium sp. LC103 TaxID=1120658 RepID=UPI000AE616B9|nr:hypothetical protein [Aquamicrobium sp. LC103]TKT75874.1 hypothetical protein XW59_018775 [Aquamicrobium sp. LC103]